VASIGTFLLFLELLNIGFDQIPPVTLITIIFNTLIYMGMISLVRLDGHVSHADPHEVCIGVEQFNQVGGAWRLVTASFYHASDIHLYYNMISFLWKGIKLEGQGRVKSQEFACLIVMFSIVTNIVCLVLNGILGTLYDENYFYVCGLGFSGVVFAIKVLSNEMTADHTVYLLGHLPIHSKYSCWAELILVQILVPNVSFTGHLAGCLVGYAYSKGPLKELMFSFLPSEWRTLRPYTHLYGSGTALRPNRRGSGSRTPNDRDHEIRGLELQQLRAAMRESLQPSQRSHNSTTTDEFFSAANGNTSTSQSTTESPNTEENVSQPSNGSGEKEKREQVRLARLKKYDSVKRREGNKKKSVKGGGLVIRGQMDLR